MLEKNYTVTNNTNSDDKTVNDNSQLNIEHVTDETDNLAEEDENVESEIEQNQTTDQDNSKVIETVDNEKVIEKVPTTDKLVHPKVKTHILYKLNNDDNWRKGYVHSRAGKVHGKYD